MPSWFPLLYLLSKSLDFTCWNMSEKLIEKPVSWSPAISFHDGATALTTPLDGEIRDHIGRRVAYHSSRAWFWWRTSRPQRRISWKPIVTTSSYKITKTPSELPGRRSSATQTSTTNESSSAGGGHSYRGLSRHRREGRESCFGC